MEEPGGPSPSCFFSHSWTPQKLILLRDLSPALQSPITSRLQVALYKSNQTKQPRQGKADTLPPHSLGRETSCTSIYHKLRFGNLHSGPPSPAVMDLPVAASGFYRWSMVCSNGHTPSSQSSSKALQMQSSSTRSLRGNGKHLRSFEM